MKSKTVFFCTECGNETPKWAGQCTACGSWNTLTEQIVATQAKSGGKKTASGSAGHSRAAPKQLTDVEAASETRFTTGLNELDRVLGGGAVYGSLVLVGGSPGIGKSTLLLQICGLMTNKKNKTNVKILYVSGEESERQLKMRAERLLVQGAGVYILAETEINEILSASHELSPDVLIIDSIQTLYNPELTSTPGANLDTR